MFRDQNQILFFLILICRRLSHFTPRCHRISLPLSLSFSRRFSLPLSPSFQNENAKTVCELFCVAHHFYLFSFLCSTTRAKHNFQQCCLCINFLSNLILELLLCIKNFVGWANPCHGNYLRCLMLMSGDDFLCHPSVFGFKPLRYILIFLFGYF